MCVCDGVQLCGILMMMCVVNIVLLVIQIFLPVHVLSDMVALVTLALLFVLARMMYVCMTAPHACVAPSVPAHMLARSIRMPDSAYGRRGSCHRERKCKGER